MEKVASFSERLNEALRIRNISAADLSRKTGITEGQMSKYTRGIVEPKADRLKMMAEVLLINPVWLMGLDVPIINNEVEHKAGFSIEMLGDPEFMSHARKLFNADQSVRDEVYDFIDFLLR